MWPKNMGGVNISVNIDELEQSDNRKQSIIWQKNKVEAVC